MCATSGDVLKGKEHTPSPFPLLTGQSKDMVMSCHGMGIKATPLPWGEWSNKTEEDM